MPLSAAAQGHIEWRAPAECPSATAARARVAELAATDRPVAKTASVSVTITRTSAHELSARIAVRSGGAKVRAHVLSDADCAALTRAAALIVALAIEETSGPARPDSATSDAQSSALDAAGNAAGTRAEENSAGAMETAKPPDSARSEGANAKETAASVAAPAKPRGSERSDSAAAVSGASSVRERTAAEDAPTPVTGWLIAAGSRQSDAAQYSRADNTQLTETRTLPLAEADRRELSLRPPLGMFVGLAGGVVGGVLPGAAVSGDFTVGLSVGRLFGALRVGYSPGRSVRLDTGAGGCVALVSAAMEGGWRWVTGGLEVPLVMGLETGFFTSRGEGVPERETRRVDWLAIYPSVGVSHTWQRLRLSVRADGLVALRRPRFAIDVGTAEPAVFHRPSAAGVRGYLVAELLLW